MNHKETRGQLKGTEMNSQTKKRLILAATMLAVVLVGVFIWKGLRPADENLVSSNGRIEATEIDVATKLGGRVHDIFVNEGDFVTNGQPLAQMHIDVLEAQRDEARAQNRQASNSVISAKAEVKLRESDKAAAEALVAQRESELDAARRRLARTEELAKSKVTSAQELDDERAQTRSAEAALSAAKAQVASGQAAIDAARAEVVGAESAVLASLATIARIEADISDSELRAPRDGRVQYRIAQPGEVLGAGGKVLNLVDLSDVYMTFFLPTRAVGRIAMGSEARIVLDAAPQYVIPASISFVASAAQFTPKTVETASEREKLMFRVRAQIGRELLQQHLKIVKTGLPGVAWVKLDSQAPWPANLAVKLPE
jgi:HlyD family secretion protein